MVVPLIPIAVAGARIAGSAAAAGARTAVKGAQVAGRGATKGVQNARGIQNARLSARTPVTGATRPNTSPALKRGDIIDTDFVERKSLPARVREQRLNGKKKQPLGQRLLNRVSGREDQGRPQSLAERLRERMSRNKLKSVRNLKKLSSMYMVLYIAAIISAFVALFGVIAFSLIAFGHSSAFFGLITVDSIAPLSSGGLLFYYIAIVLHVIGFIGMGTWMWLFEGKNPLATTIGYMATGTCLALGIVIGTQICFPLLIWVLLVEFTSISSKEESF